MEADQNRFMDQLKRDGEVRGVTCNAAFTEPGTVTIPDDVVTLAKMMKIAKFNFFDKASQTHTAPPVWPRNCNIPVFVFGDGHPSSTNRPYPRAGMDAFIDGLWYAFSQAKLMKDKEPAAEHAARRAAGRHA